MSSPEKLAANAANAQLSTGPKTPEGKQRSAQNALKHGLTARELIIRDDEREEIEQLQASLIEEVKPQGALEQVAFAQLLHAAWNLHRLRRLEAGLFTGSLDPLLNESLDKTMDRLARYQVRTERSYHRTLRDLRTLQTDRGLREAFDPPQAAAAVPFLANTSEWLKRTQPPEEMIRLTLIDPKPDHYRSPQPARTNEPKVTDFPLKPAS